MHSSRSHTNHLQTIQLPSQKTVFHILLDPHALHTLLYMIEDIPNCHYCKDPLQETPFPLAHQDPLKEVPTHQDHPAPPHHNYFERVDFAASQFT